MGGGREGGRKTWRLVLGLPGNENAGKVEPIAILSLSLSTGQYQVRSFEY